MFWLDVHVTRHSLRRRKESEEIIKLTEEGRVIEAAVPEEDMEGISDRAFHRQSLHLFKSPGGAASLDVSDGSEG